MQNKVSLLKKLIAGVFAVGMLSHSILAEDLKIILVDGREISVPWNSSMLGLGVEGSPLPWDVVIPMDEDEEMEQFEYEEEYEEEASEMAQDGEDSHHEVRNIVRQNTSNIGVETAGGSENLASVAPGTTGEVSEQAGSEEESVMDANGKIFRNQIKGIIVPSCVESIGIDTFNGFENLASVTLPKNLKIINSEAFSRCSSLSEISIPASVEFIGEYAFMGCTSLSSVSFVHAETELAIEAYAFGGCRHLEKISINRPVFIGLHAFWGCSRLESADFPEQLRASAHASFGCLFLRENLGSRIFDSQNGTPIRIYVALWDGTTRAQVIIQAIEVPNVIYSIKYLILEKLLATPGFIERYEPVRKIAAFLEKINAGNFEFATDWETYSRYMEEFSYLIKAVRIEGKIKTIGAYSFKNCANLMDLSLLTPVEYIEKEACSNCKALTAIEIPQSVKAIGSFAFSGCTRLENFSIPPGVKSIEDGTFMGCERLVSVNIPSDVTFIGTSAFDGCRRLTEIEVPRGVTHIGDGAFYDCENLERIALSNAFSSNRDTLRRIGLEDLSRGRIVNPR